MKYISPFFSDARNKLGGSVFARNRSGVYARAKVNPAQPRTTSQVNNRVNFGSFATLWATLSQSRIQAWNKYAETATLTDSLGHKFRPSGIQAFISSNRYSSFINNGQVLDPPAYIFPFPIVTPIQFYIGLNHDGTLAAAIQANINWPDYEGQVVVSATPGISPGITFIKRSTYRRLPQTFTAAGVDLYIQAAYDQVLPLPAAGTRVGVRFQLVHPDNGIASVVLSADSIVAQY